MSFCVMERNLVAQRNCLLGGYCPARALSPSSWRSGGIFSIFADKPARNLSVCALLCPPLPDYMLKYFQSNLLDKATSFLVQGMIWQTYPVKSKVSKRYDTPCLFPPY
uniref:Uncharacterized protein n=1 Tax=Lepeophtheirus salmonis TaxID=72036 RepID=A0A0K2V5T0_LEPSM